MDLRLYAILLGLIFSRVGSARDFKEFVIGGQTVDITKIPAIFPEYGSVSGHIHIGPHVSLTCGHCLEYAPGKNYEYPPNVETKDSWPVGRLADLASAFDIALMIENDQEFKDVVSIESAQLQAGQTLTFIGSGRNVKGSNSSTYCGGYEEPMVYKWALLKILDVGDARFAANGTGLGPGGTPVVTCPGDSGGYFFTTSADGRSKLAGINSTGSHGETDTAQELDPHSTVVIPPYTSGAIDLTSDEIQQWLRFIAKKRNVAICGINLICPTLKLPL